MGKSLVQQCESLKCDIIMIFQCVIMRKSYVEQWRTPMRAKSENRCITSSRSHGQWRRPAYDHEEGQYSLWKWERALICHRRKVPFVTISKADLWQWGSPTKVKITNFHVWHWRSLVNDRKEVTCVTKRKSCVWQKGSCLYDNRDLTQRGRERERRRLRKITFLVRSLLFCAGR